MTWILVPVAGIIRHDNNREREVAVLSVAQMSFAPFPIHAPTLRCGKAGQWQHALRLVDELEALASESLEPDTILYNIAIDAVRICSHACSTSVLLRLYYPPLCVVLFAYTVCFADDVTHCTVHHLLASLACVRVTAESTRLSILSCISIKSSYCLVWV